MKNNVTTTRASRIERIYCFYLVDIATMWKFSQSSNKCSMYAGNSWGSDRV